jgi:hypothetical protein
MCNNPAISVSVANVAVIGSALRTVAERYGVTSVIPEKAGEPNFDADILAFPEWYSEDAVEGARIRQAERDTEQMFDDGGIRW